MLTSSDDLPTPPPPLLSAFDFSEPERVRAKETTFFSPTFNSFQTLLRGTQIREAREAALQYSLYGLNDAEITDELQGLWPDLDIIEVITVSEGNRILIEAV